MVNSTDELLEFNELKSLWRNDFADVAVIDDEQPVHSPSLDQPATRCLIRGSLCSPSVIVCFGIVPDLLG